MIYLITQESDLIAAAITITQSRSKYIHFTEPYSDVGKSLLAYRKKQDESRLWSFLDPFDLTTTVVIGAITVIVCIVHSLSRRLSRYNRFETADSTDSCPRSTISEVSRSFWVFYTSAMQQGPETIPSVSGKILVGGWFFFCLVIVATYTANLAAFLTANSFTTNINSLNELAKQSDILYGTVKDSSILDFLNESTLPIHQRMYDFMTSVDGALVDTAEEAIQRVERQTKGDYIFIWDEPILEYFASNEPCQSVVIGRKFNMHAYGLALPKGMPYAENFSLAILKLRESGIYEGLTTKWLKEGICSTWHSPREATDVKQLRIVDMKGVFIILAVAVGMSVVVAVVQRVTWIVRRQRKVSNTRPSNGGDITIDLQVSKYSSVLNTVCDSHGQTDGRTDRQTDRRTVCYI